MYREEAKKLGGSSSERIFQTMIDQHRRDCEAE